MIINRSTIVILCLSFLAARPLHAEDQPVVSRPDGTRIDWYLDHQKTGTKQGLIVLAQGSGCDSVLLNPNIAAAKSLLPDFAVVTVDKYGVMPGEDHSQSDKDDDCSKTFNEKLTISQRVEDYRRVVAAVEAEPWWNGQLVLFGASEGGAVVQIMAADPDVTAAVVYSSATGLPFREAFIQVLPPSLAQTVPHKLDDIRLHPDASTLWLGNSYRWWADIIDRRLSDDLLKAKAPILVVQGRRDASNPVSSARALKQAFDAAGRQNLTYWEYADYDHTMLDPQGKSHRDEVFARITTWLKDKTSPNH